MYRDVTSGSDTQNAALDVAASAARESDAADHPGPGVMAKVCLVVSLLVPLVLQLFARYA